MPIYEFACPRCRVVFSFLSKRVNPTGSPACPRCGGRRLHKEVSAFAAPRGAQAPAAAGASGGGEEDFPMPDLNDPRVEREMTRMERDMESLDENNPRHLAQMMRRMQKLMPPGATTKEMEAALRRLEAGEDPDKIEEDMGDLTGGAKGGAGGAPYERDGGLYDY